MTSQPGPETIAIHILPNISRSKGNQAIKFGQVIEDNKTNIFLKKVCRSELEKGLFLFFKKALCEVKASGLELSFNIFR